METTARNRRGRAAAHSDTIDRLYQLPLEQFTSARNALAKTAGGDAARIKALARPPLPAWAVNQVFWQDRQTYDALLGASNDLRGIHRAILAGKRADTRAATKAHDAAVTAALESALAVLSRRGQRATDQTRQAIVTTLRALPGADPPGRLTRTLQPGGFEMLAGLPIAAARPEKAGAASAYEGSPKGLRYTDPKKAVAQPASQSRSVAQPASQSRSAAQPASQPRSVAQPASQCAHPAQ